MQDWATYELLDKVQAARAMVASMPVLFNALAVADALVAQRTADADGAAAEEGS